MHVRGGDAADAGGVSGSQGDTLGVLRRAPGVGDEQVQVAKPLLVLARVGEGREEVGRRSKTSRVQVSDLEDGGGETSEGSSEVLESESSDSRSSGDVGRERSSRDGGD